MKFRKKPIVIEATQFTEGMIEAHLFDGGDLPDGVCFARADYHRAERRVYWSNYYIETLEGKMAVVPGDWIITGVKGERYPCKPDIFALTYDAEDSTPMPGEERCEHGFVRDLGTCGACPNFGRRAADGSGADDRIGSTCGNCGATWAHGGEVRARNKYRAKVIEECAVWLNRKLGCYVGEDMVANMRDLATPFTSSATSTDMKSDDRGKR